MIPKNNTGYDNPFRAKDSKTSSNTKIVEEVNQEIDIYLIKQKFNDIKQNLGRKFKTFIPIIKVAEPTNYSDNILTLSLPTVFYKNRLSKLSPEIEIVLKEIFKKDIRVNCIVETDTNLNLESSFPIETSKNQKPMIDLIDLEDNKEKESVDKKIVSVEDIKEEFKDFL